MPLSLALTFAVGCLITLHIAMNARLGEITGNAWLANCVFWFVGCATSLALGGVAYEPGFIARVGRAPAWLLFAGAIGAGIAAFNNAMLPRIGVANLTFFLFLGQVVVSALLSTTGVMGGPREDVTWPRAIGVLLVVIGTVLFAYGRSSIRG